MYCSYCGMPQPDAARYCISCGQPLGKAPPPGATPTTSSATAPTAAPASADFPFQAVIPTRNPPALVAYYLGVFSIIPCFAPLIGLPAFIAGVKGLRRAPEVGCGRFHAWVGIVLGGGMFLISTAAAVVFIIAIREGR